MPKHRLITCPLVLLPMLFLGTTASASECATSLLSAQSGKSWLYEVAYKGMGTQAQRKLSQLEGGWRVEQSMSLLIVSLNEESSLELSGDELLTKSYIKEQKGLGARTTKISVDSNSGLVRTEYKGETQSYPYKGKPSDPLAHTLQIQIDRNCRSLDDPLEYNLLGRGGVRSYIYKFQGEETLSSPWGEVVAERWQREAAEVRDTLWLAPEQQYALVRMEHEEKGELSSLQLTEIK